MSLLNQIKNANESNPDCFCEARGTVENQTCPMHCEAHSVIINEGETCDVVRRVENEEMKECDHRNDIADFDSVQRLDLSKTHTNEELKDIEEMTEIGRAKEDLNTVTNEESFHRLSGTCTEVAVEKMKTTSMCGSGGLAPLPSEEILKLDCSYVCNIDGTPVKTSICNDTVVNHERSNADIMKELAELKNEICEMREVFAKALQIILEKV